MRPHQDELWRKTHTLEAQHKFLFLSIYIQSFDSVFEGKHTESRYEAATTVHHIKSSMGLFNFCRVYRYSPFVILLQVL